MNETGVDPDIVYEIPWIKDALEGAGTLISSGVNVEFAIFMVVLLPILMRGLQLLGVYVRTHNIDKRETIRIESLRSRLELRKEFGQLYDQEMADDAILKLQNDIDAWK